ncbi:MAG: hypothetical protein ABFS35_02525 [Bacteroidota bacterium]
MNNQRKLKSDKSIVGLAQPVIALFLFGLFFALGGLSMAFYTLSFVYAMYAISTFYLYVLTQNSDYWVILFFQLFTAFFIVANPKGPEYISHAVFLFLTINMTFFLIWSGYLMFTKKMKWRGREILELAAINVEKHPGTYTDRPQPTGKVVYNKEELDQFVNFFRKNLLGLVKTKDNTIYFIPVRMGQEFSVLFNPNLNYVEKTWVSIDFNGQISTFISKEDYLEYKEDLSLHQLSQSMSDVMTDFIELFLKGEKIRVMDKMDNLRINVFT